MDWGLTEKSEFLRSLIEIKKIDEQT